MAVLTQDQIKAYFETGDLPTEAQFIDLIDTLESNSAVKSTTINVVGSPTNIEDDFNATTTIVQTSKQINVVLYEKEYYLFNAGIGSWGLGETAATAANFIQTSTSIDNTELPVNLVNIISDLAEGVLMTVDTLVTQVNASDSFVHASNAVTNINYYSAFSNQTRYNFLFDGPPDTYGFGNTTVDASMFVLVEQRDTRSTVAARQIDITWAGGGDIVADFNADTNGPWFAGWSPAEVIVITHHSDPKYRYLFAPETNPAGGPILYGISPGTPVTADNFVLIDDNTWQTLLPDFSLWDQQTSILDKTVNVTTPATNGITGIIHIINDIDFTGKMEVRGYISMNGARVATDKLIDIVNVTYNCTNPKLVYLSDETNDVMYLCKWESDGLYAAESIGDGIVLDIDSYYYYDNSYTAGA